MEALQDRNFFDYDDLIACTQGHLFGEGNARLPAPPMLMFDRISEISKSGGVYGKGIIRAELALKPEMWFFDCHFKGDAVMPGCLGLDAMWQLVGFFLGWCGGKGRGRALGAGEIRFDGQALPSTRTISYRMDIKRVIRGQIVMGVADGALKIDGRKSYTAKNLRVGLFTDEMLKKGRR